MTTPAVHCFTLSIRLRYKYIQSHIQTERSAHKHSKKQPIASKIPLQDKHSHPPSLWTSQSALMGVLGGRFVRLKEPSLPNKYQNAHSAKCWKCVHPQFCVSEIMTVCMLVNCFLFTAWTSISPLTNPPSLSLSLKVSLSARLWPILQAAVPIKAARLPVKLL